MARIYGNRILLDDTQNEAIIGWAIVVHGKTKADMLYTSREVAETAARAAYLGSCEVIEVSVSGRFVQRTGG